MRKHFDIFPNSKGFTLSEIIVSMGILAMVLVSTISLFSSSILNTKIIRNSINAKYLAEKYMEIVKGTGLNDLAAVLGADGFGDIVTSSAVTTYTNNELGVEITLSEGSEQAGGTGGQPANFSGVLNVSADSIITGASITPTTVRLTADASIFHDIASNAYFDTLSSTDDPVRLKLYFNGGEEINITNESSTPIEFYCVNKTDTRELPEFTITEGRVSFHDYTTSLDRLPEETDEMFTSGQSLTLRYDITVTVKNETGTYELQGTKAIY